MRRGLTKRLFGPRKGGRVTRRKKLLALAMAVLIFSGLFLVVDLGIFGGIGFQEITIDDVLRYTSERIETDDVVAVSSEDPFYPMIGTPLAVWYDVGDRTSGYGLKPLLVVDGVVNDAQRRFLSMTGQDTATVLGDAEVGLQEDNYEAPPPKVSVQMAKREFMRTAGAVVVPYDQDGYEFAVSGAALASYLNIPVLVMDDNAHDISGTLSNLDAKYIIALGRDARSIGRTFKMPTIVLDGQKDVRKASLRVVQDRFGRLDYMVMTNPMDIVPPKVVESNVTMESGHMQNLNLLVGGNNLELSGESSHHYDLTVPDGPVLVKVWANITSYDTYLRRVKREIGVEPIISLEIRGADGNIVAYSPSFAHKKRSAYTEFLVVNYTKAMDLKVSLFYGTKGLSTIFWASSGYSRVDADYEVTIETSVLEDPHWPLLEGDSMMGPYLAASHGGIVVAENDFEFTDEEYAMYADGVAGGPWYDWAISFTSTLKADAAAEVLNETVEMTMDYEAGSNGTLFDTYTGDHGWLALLGDTNMIPLHYYPKLENWKEDPIYGVGWPGDNVYNYNGTLSPARVMGQGVADVSTMVARTLFYKEYSMSYIQNVDSDYPDPNQWSEHYGLLYGEGGGQTGGLFWQDPFTVELEQHGWSVLKYGNNLNNDRQTMEAIGAYERANYFEIMLHGNWYWYVPELNGADSYSTAVKNTDINEWEMGPTVFLTAACLMGRVDGLPPETQISMSFIHAGVNAVYSATRSTGSESSTREIERNLMYNDTSVGEALRDQKNWKPAKPTVYVRLMFGDPAFNPFEPENGFSDQGRPVMI